MASIIRSDDYRSLLFYWIRNQEYNSSDIRIFFIAESSCIKYCWDGIFGDDSYFCGCRSYCISVYHNLLQQRGFHQSVRSICFIWSACQCTQAKKERKYLAFQMLILLFFVCFSILIIIVSIALWLKQWCKTISYWLIFILNTAQQLRELFCLFYHGLLISYLRLTTRMSWVVASGSLKWKSPSYICKISHVKKEIDMV